jgi:hypothetical protein
VDCEDLLALTIHTKPGQLASVFADYALCDALIFLILKE